MRPAGTAPRGRLVALALLLGLVVPARTVAQDAHAPYEQAIRTTAAFELAARQALVSQATHTPVADDVLAPRRSHNKSEGVTLMIIGGAAVVVGAIAGGGGGEVLIAAGLICAGYGLYVYSQ